MCRIRANPLHNIGSMGYDQDRTGRIRSRTEKRGGNSSELKFVVKRRKMPPSCGQTGFKEIVRDNVWYEK